MPDRTATSAQVRDRVLAAVGAGEIYQKRSRLRWRTHEPAYRILTAAEREDLLALLSEGLIRFVRDRDRGSHDSYEIVPAACPVVVANAEGDVPRLDVGFILVGVEDVDEFGGGRERCETGDGG